MNFIVLSRPKAKEFSYQKTSMPYVIISITDIDANAVVFNKSPQLKAVLRLSFEDVDRETPTSITQQDAQKIVEFVQAWMDYVDLFVVHCEAGISRSAGVCAALMLWINGDDSPIFNKPLYKPNMRCYRMVLNELDDKMSQPAEHILPPMGIGGIRLCGHYDEDGKLVCSAADWDEDGDDYEIC